MVRAIRTIPGPLGWWHADGERTFAELAKELTELGLKPEQVVDFLERAYGAASQEFGN